MRSEYNVHSIHSYPHPNMYCMKHDETFIGKGMDYTDRHIPQGVGGILIGDDGHVVMAGAE